LKVFAASDLTDGATMAVETNLSTYAIPARGNFPGRTGYTMSLRHVYILGSTALGSAAPLESPPRTVKRQGDPLVSPRSNKKAGQPAVFSDED
jgi:hypothetical protein